MNQYVMKLTLMNKNQQMLMILTMSMILKKRLEKRKQKRREVAVKSKFLKKIRKTGRI